MRPLARNHCAAAPSGESANDHSSLALLVSPTLFALDGIDEIGAALRTALRLYRPQLADLVIHHEHVETFKQTHTVTDVEARRQVMPDHHRALTDPAAGFDAQIVDAETPAELTAEQIAAEQAECGGGAVHLFAFGMSGLRHRPAQHQIRQRVGLAHGRVGKDGDLGRLERAAHQQASGDGVDLAHRAHVEAGVVDRPAEEQQAAALDGELLAVGAVFAFHYPQLAGGGGGLLRRIGERHVAGEFDPQAEAGEAYEVAEANAPLAVDLPVAARLSRAFRRHQDDVVRGRHRAAQFPQSNIGLGHQHLAGEIDAVARHAEAEIGRGDDQHLGGIYHFDALATQRHLGKPAARAALAGVAAHGERAVAGAQAAVDADVIAVVRTHTQIDRLRADAEVGQVGAAVAERHFADQLRRVPGTVQHHVGVVTVTAAERRRQADAQRAQLGADAALFFELETELQAERFSVEYAAQPTAAVAHPDALLAAAQRLAERAGAPSHFAVGGDHAGGGGAGRGVGVDRAFDHGALRQQVLGEWHGADGW